MDAIGPDAVAVIPAASEQVRNRDVDYPFRQDSDFRYLTGFNEPDAWAVIAPGHPDGEFVLFCRPKDKEREIWDGYRAGPEGCVRDHDADRGEVIGELDAKIEALLDQRSTVYYTLGKDRRRDARVTAWIESLRQQVRLGRAAPDGVVSLDSVLHAMRQIKSAAEIAMMRHAAVYDNDADRQKALDAIRLVLGQFENLFRNAGDVVNGFPKQIPLEELAGREQYDPAMLEENLLFGSPDTVIEKLKRYEALGVDAFIYYASMGLDLDAQKRSMKLFCDEVMPAFN